VMGTGVDDESTQSSGPRPGTSAFPPAGVTGWLDSAELAPAVQSEDSPALLVQYADEVGVLVKETVLALPSDLDLSAATQSALLISSVLVPFSFLDSGGGAELVKSNFWLLALPLPSLMSRLGSERETVAPPSPSSCSASATSEGLGVRI